jgi:hypothetical protein
MCLTTHVPLPQGERSLRRGVEKGAGGGETDGLEK